MGRFGLLLLLLLLAPASGARGRGLPWRPMTLPSPGGDRTIDEEIEDIPEDIPGDISEEDELDDTPPPLPLLPPHEFLKREHTWTTGAKKGETSFLSLSLLLRTNSHRKQARRQQTCKMSFFLHYQIFWLKFFTPKSA